MRVLLVEDHDDLAGLVGEHLNRVGFAVDRCARADEALHALTIVRYDAVVLDLGLPDADGHTVLAALRQDERGLLTPLVILTARDGVEHRVKGLNAGADDYLVKPFDLVELEARLRAILRRPGSRSSVKLRFGDLVFDPSSLSARLSNGTLDLAKKEYALLDELIRAAPGVVIKDSIEDRLYSFEEPVTPNAIEALVSRLRKKMAAAGAEVRIETLRGIGYRLVIGGEDAVDP